MNIEKMEEIVRNEFYKKYGIEKGANVKKYFAEGGVVRENAGKTINRQEKKRFCATNLLSFEDGE